jgi:hypothetical protein
MRSNYCHSARILNHAGMLFGLCCIVALAGCDSGATAGGQTQKATATVTPYPTVQPASTNGWAIYTDKRFHFQAQIPPGWKAMAYTAYECPQGGDGAYIA